MVYTLKPNVLLLVSNFQLVGSNHTSFHHPLPPKALQSPRHVTGCEPSSLPHGLQDTCRIQIKRFSSYRQQSLSTGATVYSCRSQAAWASLSLVLLSNNVTQGTWINLPHLSHEAEDDTWSPSSIGHQVSTASQIFFLNLKNFRTLHMEKGRHTFSQMDSSLLNLKSVKA